MGIVFTTGKLVLIGMLGLSIMLLLVPYSKSLELNYYYSPECPHCQKVSPLINSVSSHFKVNQYDVSKGSYFYSATPTVVVKTLDCREIVIQGSKDIPNHLPCEVIQMSSKKCTTYSSTQGYNLKTKSWFIR